MSLSRFLWVLKRDEVGWLYIDLMWVALELKELKTFKVGLNSPNYYLVSKYQCGEQVVSENRDVLVGA